MAPISLPEPPAAWSNQDIIVYHGTLDVHAAALTSGKVSVPADRGDTDFGRGFYTTTCLRQAESWAKRASYQNSGTRPAVLQFTISRSREALPPLHTLAFVRGHDSADDLWSLIHHCRGGARDHIRNNGFSG